MDRIRKYIDRIFDKQNDPSIRIKILLVVGTVAILLLALPDMASVCSTTEVKTETGQLELTEYADQLEARLEEMISAIDGAGKTRVMVTLQNGIEYVYASEDKTSVNTSENTGSNGSQSSEAKENSENSYIIIKDDSGERALIRTELMPTVNGVVVICEGADDPVTAERILSVVTTALNISSKRVCITLLSKEQ